MGQVVMLSAFRPEVEPRVTQVETDDVQQNTWWDSFMQIANEAWEWRDHETLDRILELVGKLRSRLEIQVTDPS